MTGRSAFVCAECMRPVRNPYEQFDERLEYRRRDGVERRLTMTVRPLCRDCVDRIAAARRNPEGWTQPALEVDR